MAGSGTGAARPRRLWLRMFGTGLGLWLLTVVVIFLTGNPNLIPTLVLLGSFLVPVTFVAWAFSRRHSGELTAELVLSTFVTGGVLGVLAASVLETYLLHPSPWLFLGVGLIEEAVKLAALAVLTRRLAHKDVRDGLVLGAAVGFGFAAFESAGYAFTALFTERGLSVADLVETELLRGLLAPVGHGLWTAILGGVLFSSSVREHFALTGRLVVSYLGVSVLHALWDSMHGIALLLTLVLTGTPAQDQLLAQGYQPQPTPLQAHLFTLLSWGGLAVVALLGLVWLHAVRRHADRVDTSRVWWRIPTPGPR
ncbi:PrsW family intramembrane metalloprotease [Amycolatopsis viridis]|uniref:RsiW-degrading membrane proteinase PrsW (M82 family) n=1 Tax=Amycolatopsis viridis TaxID=185678 RepID=A0ABX0STG7_9PSEU|nr:PrsW family glutamic-type intramembrane protease [Amycolatopsis viridis]NIH80252.1 RsiW-degrading membrane proteinase PrsW (M82 family) [Amycolatopsis viridis]